MTLELLHNNQIRKSPGVLGAGTNQSRYEKSIAVEERKKERKGEGKREQS